MKYLCHAAQAVARGLRRLGLTGTRWLVESDVYPGALAARRVAAVRPEAAERDEINRIIMDELVDDVIMAEATTLLQRMIGRVGEVP